MKPNKYIMSNIVRMRLVNRGENPVCIICGVSIETGDAYISTKHSNHRYKIYCVEHAEEKNII